MREGVGATAQFNHALGVRINKSTRVAPDTKKSGWCLPGIIAVGNMYRSGVVH